MPLSLAEFGRLIADPNNQHKKRLRIKKLVFRRSGWLIRLSHAWHFHSLKEVVCSTPANLEDKYVYIAVRSLWQLLEAKERNPSTGELQSTCQVPLHLASLHGDNTSKYLLFQREKEYEKAWTYPPHALGDLLHLWGNWYHFCKELPLIFHNQVARKGQSFSFRPTKINTTKEPSIKWNLFR